MPPVPEAAEAAVLPVDDSLGRQVRAGLGWSMVNTLVSRAWTVGVGLILARLLAPRDYGIFTVGFVVLNVLQSMNELGVSVAIVRWKGDPRRPARTAVTLSLASSVLLYGLCFFAAPAVASALRAPDATGVLRLLTLGVVIDGLSSIPSALITRGLLQRRMALADTAALAVSSGLTLALAVGGRGAYSLVWGSLAGNLTATTLLYAMAPVRPRPGFHAEDARRLLSFGLPLAGSSFLVFAMLNTDYVIVGRTLGPVMLGFYVLAFNLSSWPNSLLSLSIRRVSIPAFSRLADDQARAGRQFRNSFRMLMTVVVPIVVVLSTLAAPAVRVLYGDRWLPSIAVVHSLAVLGGARVAFDLFYDYLVAVGRSRAVLWVQGLWLAALVPALVLGAHFGGIAGVGLAHAAVAVLVVGPAFAVALRRSGVAPLGLLRSLARPAGAAAAAAPAALVVAGAVRSDWLKLVAGTTASFAVYVPLAVPLNSVVRATRHWHRSRRRPAEAPVSPARAPDGASGGRSAVECCEQGLDDTFLLGPSDSGEDRK